MCWVPTANLYPVNIGKSVMPIAKETRSGNRTADKIFDLQESTFWMTVDNVAYPHQLVIDLSKVETVTGFRYLPRAKRTTRA